MHCRGLIHRFVVLLAIVACAPAAHAHGLVAEYRVISGPRIQIEAWYDPGGPAAGAAVSVFDKSDKLLEEGKLDKHGVYVFTLKPVVAVRVVIAESGHRRELAISQAEIARGAGTWKAEESNKSGAQRSQVGIAEGLVGIAFLLALAAFILGIRNASELSRIRQQLEDRPGA